MYIFSHVGLLIILLTISQIVLSASNLTVSTDGSCGGTSDETCLGSRWGNCCSSRGFCGKVDTYCGAGCQTDFGACYANASLISSDGSCGHSGSGKICLGSTFGNCCSPSGFCGSNGTYCGTGCQSSYGTCGGSSGATASASTVVLHSTTTATATASSSSAASTSPAIASTSGLSSGAKAGIGVGVALGVLLILSLLALFLFRRRRQQRTSSSQIQHPHRPELPTPMTSAAHGDRQYGENKLDKDNGPTNELPASSAADEKYLTERRPVGGAIELPSTAGGGVAELEGRPVGSELS